MKKTIPLLLASILLFVGCGDDTKPTQEERTKEQLLARISELEEENRTLKQQIETQAEPQEQANEEIEQPAEDTQEQTQVEEKAPASEETASNDTNIQYIQTQPGNTQQANYFELTSDNAVYKQTGDAFVAEDEYGNGEVVVIPMQYTNNGDDASDPWLAFILDYNAKQEDDVQEYTLNGGTAKGYENEPMMNIKPGATIDYYLTYALEQGHNDVMIEEQWKNKVVETLKFQ